MKRTVIIAFVTVVLYLCVGAARLLIEGVHKQRLAMAEHKAVSADLEQLYTVLKSRKDRTGEFPRAWQDVQSDIPRLNQPIAEYELHPGASKFEPLVVYNGRKLRAQGYNVLGSGTVTNGKMQIGEAIEVPQ